MDLITHTAIDNFVLNDNSTVVGKLCSYTSENRAVYILGEKSVDLTVIYYFQEGGKEYRLSHNWDFQQQCMAQAITIDEQCFCWGVAAHLIADGISHTQLIPAAIEKFRMPNLIIHPLLEKKFDSALALKFPELVEQTAHSMDALNGPKGDRYVQMIDDALGANSMINVKDELVKLKIAVSGSNFYNSQFNPSTAGSTWIFQGYYYVDKLTNFLAPYIGTVNFGEIDYYYEKSKEQTINTFNNWGSRYQLSPHGFDEISVANQKTSSSLTIVFIGVLGLPIILSFIKRNKAYLLLIPILFILAVVGVYALL